VLDGFSVIVAVIAVGYVIAVADVLGPTATTVLARLVLYVGAPALLLSTLATADLGAAMSSGLVVSACSAAWIAGVYVAISRRLWRRAVAETTIGALASSYVNAANLGLPIAVYVLGDAAFAVPVLMLQVLVITPVVVTILDATSNGPQRSRRRLLAQPLRMPITLACFAGLLLNVVGIQLPDPIVRPIDLLAGAAVPAALLAYGMSLRGAPRPGTGYQAHEVWLCVALKTLAQPAAAFVIGRFALNLRGTALLAVSLMAGLPTAQNVFVYATSFAKGGALARDCVLLTTVISIPVLAVIATLVG
jgi:predicted permease